MKTAVLVSLLLFCSVLTAGPLQVGAALPTMTFKDQHDAPRTITSDTRYLVFAAERAPAALVEAALGGQSAGTLEVAKVRYVADISAMPGIITSMIALPKMRKQPYPMLLGRTPDETAMLPREPGKVTVIESQGGQITAVRFFGDAVTLSAALGFRP